MIETRRRKKPKDGAKSAQPPPAPPAVSLNVKPKAGAPPIQAKPGRQSHRKLWLPICGVALFVLIGAATATFFYRAVARQNAERVAANNPAPPIAAEPKPDVESVSPEMKDDGALAAAKLESGASDANAADKSETPAPDSSVKASSTESQPEKKEPEKNESLPSAAPPVAAPATAAPAKSVAEKKPAQGATDQNPFRSFPTAVQLPTLADKNGPHADAMKPLDLGKLQIDPKAICVVHLLGGETALKGRQKFLFDAADGGTAERDWDVSFDDGKTNTPDVKIAHVALRDQKLTFQWTEDAVKLPVAANLCNCVLRISAGKGTHAVALRKSIAGDGVGIGFVGEKEAKWDIPWPPNSEQVQVELRLPREFGDSRFIGSTTLRGPSETTWIEFLGKRRAPTGLRLKVDCEMKRQVSITIAPFFVLSPESKPTRLTTATLKKQREVAKNAVAQLEATLNRMPPPPPQGKKGPPRGAPPNPRVMFEQQLAQARQVLEQLDEITELKDRLEGKGDLQVRVFMDVEGVPVDLLTTAGVKRAGKK